jgi:AraC-like DNA-binding protein
MIVFDTAAVPARERADAMVEALLQSTQCTTLAHHGPLEHAYLRQHNWTLGPVELQRTECSPLRLARTRRQTARDDVPTVALGIHLAGRGWQAQSGVETRLGLGTVFAVELDRPSDHHELGHTIAHTVKIPAHHLGLPEGLVRDSRGRLGASPVHGIFHRHLQTVVDQADDLESDATARMVGEATVQLARALVASASPDERLTADALDETLLLRVQSHVRDHLHDPQLQPAAVAAALHISVRHLYRVCSDGGLRLEQWIIQERLGGARDELSRPGTRRLTIAAVARRWGFSNASHFTHRFRDAYGMTPREWQAFCVESR